MARFALVSAAVGVVAVLVLVVAGAAVHAPTVNSAALVFPATPTASPRPTGHAITAAETAAGKLYLVAAAAVNTAEREFDTAWVAAENAPCRCSSGQHDQSAAMALVPRIETALLGMRDTLLKIQQQVPSVSGQIDIVRTDDDLVLQEFKGAYQAFTNQDLSAMGKSLDAAAAEQSSSEQDFVRLRFDLGLPPPPGVLPVT
jgi:hypothetical protein